MLNKTYIKFEKKDIIIEFQKNGGLYESFIISSIIKKKNEIDGVFIYGYDGEGFLFKKKIKNWFIWINFACSATEIESEDGSSSGEIISKKILGLEIRRKKIEISNDQLIREMGKELKNDNLVKWLT